MANRRFIDFPIAASVGDNDIVLIWQDGLNKQTTKSTLFAGSPSTLASLTDVDISALTNGQILQYNSTTSKWENVDRTDIDLDQLGDVTIVSPTNGQVLVYNSSTSKWENSSGGFVPYTGAVTTVNLGAQSILAGTFVKAGGTSAQFLKADGSVDSTAYGTGSVTSVGLSMPSAFNVASSPVTTSGTIAVTAAGNATQYVRGDGVLATLPTSGEGGGASVSYYLNGSVNQGTIGGVTYYEMNKTPIIGAGTDFTRNSNGYIASFLTDANDPSLLVIPAGNWNFETYFEASSGGGSPTFYLELYKYDGTTFNLIASNSGSPKLINDGTSIEAYFSALAVPQTTLTLTDRLAIRIYVTTAGRTLTLHTENGHLCQVITTFTTGLTALNGLTSQVQFFAVGTSGTNFNIASATDTHTFNLPTASATNRGALSSTDWSTFNNKQNQLNGTGFVKANGTTISYDNSTYQVTSEKGQPNGYASLDGNGKVPLAQINDALIGNVNYQGLWNAATNNPTLVNPPASGTKGYYYIVSTAGTFASISFEVGDWIISNGSAWQKVDNTDAVSSVFGRTGNVVAANGDYNTSQVTENTNLYFTNARSRQAISLTTTGTSGAATYDNSTGVFNIPQYQAAGNFVTIDTNQTITGVKIFELTDLRLAADGNVKETTITNINADYAQSTIRNYFGFNNSNNIFFSSPGKQGAILSFNYTQQREYALPDASGTIALVGGAGVGTVTSVAALTLGTSGTDLSSTVANGTTTPVITLNVPTASATNRGALSAADWTAFNSKQQALNGTGFVKISGTTISYDNSTYLTGNQTITLSGDATGSGATAITVVLANSGVTSGTYNDSATQVRPFTVDAKGRITSIGTAVTITPDWANISGQRTLTRDDAGLQGNAGARSGFFQSEVPVNYYSGANSWQHLIESRHTNDSNNYAMQIAGSFFDQEFYVRKTNNSATTAWSKLWHSGNITPVTGTGTTNYLPKFTGASTIGNSIVSESGSVISIAGNLNVGSLGNLAINAGSAATPLLTQSTNYTELYRRSGGVGIYLGGTGDPANYYDNAIHYFRSSGGGATRMTLDNSGNLGLGVTPSAWSSSWRAFEFQAAAIAWTGAGANDFSFSTNSFFDTTDSRWEYKGTGDGAARYSITALTSEHRWFNAPIGTAGNAISFTQAMTLGTNSGLSIGTPSAAPAQGLLVQGEGRFLSDLSLDTTVANTQRGLIFRDAGTVRWQVYKSTVNDFRIYRQGSSNDALVIGTNDAATFSSSVTATQFKTPGFVEPASVRGLFNNTNYSGPGWNNAALVTGNGATGVMMGGDAALYAYGWIQGVQTDTGGVKGLYLNPLGGAVTVGGAATFSSSVTATSIIRSGGTSSQYLMADGSVSTLTNPVTGTGTAGQVAYWSSGSAITGESNLFWDATNDRLGIGRNNPSQRLDILGSGTVYANIENSDANIAAVITKNTSKTFTTGLVTDYWAVIDSTSGSNTRLMIESGGNVLINTTTNVTGANLNVNGNIRTAAPTGGSAENWKLGNAVNGTVNANRLIRVEIAGIGYDLVARQII